MAVYFFDSSAIVKRYLSETGTVWVSSITDLATGCKVYLAGITLVEVISAITRKARGSGLSETGARNAVANFRRDFEDEYSQVELTQPLIELAANLAQSHGLRAYDAVQLACALEINAERIALGAPPLTLISADAALNTAAIAEGLAVDDPNAHP